MDTPDRDSELRRAVNASGPKLCFADDIRDRLTSHEHKQSALYGQCSRHSAQYCSALRLTEDDVERLCEMRGNVGMYPKASDYFGTPGSVTVEVEGEAFALVAMCVCTWPYGGSWEYLIMAIADNEVLHETTGYGTTSLWVVSGEWHGRILFALRNENGEDDSE